MSILLATLLLALNFGISWYNARTVGLSWYDAKGCNIWIRILLWSGAIMSAAGFSACYSGVLAVSLYATHLISLEQATAILNIVYLCIILPILGSGLAITVHSIAEAWRTRKMADMGVAAYNTFAQLYNTKEAWSGIPDAISGLGKFFSSDDKDEDDNKALIVILIALAAMGAGILTTVVIINKTATRQAKKVLRQTAQS